MPPQLKATNLHHDRCAQCRRMDQVTTVGSLLFYHRSTCHSTRSFRSLENHTICRSARVGSMKIPKPSLLSPLRGAGFKVPLHTELLSLCTFRPSICSLARKGAYHSLIRPPVRRSVYWSRSRRSSTIVIIWTVRTRWAESSPVP